MNFVFISPNFPDNFRNFCNRLHRNGVTVLGIGDASYDSLSDDLKSSLTEYYKVNSMEDYDQVYRAVAYFAFKYGRIDWVESNNEYWLELDSKLRQDFNVTTGVQPDELALWKSKAAMKPVYRAAGIPSARQHRVTTIEAARDFLDEIGGYPVFAKPNVGVGASETFKIDSDEDLKAFFDAVSGKDYVMEEYIVGDIYTYDAICDSNGDPLFESSFRCPNVAESVNDDTEALIFILPDIPEQLREYGRKALKVEPVLALKTRVAQVRSLPAGTTLGYGRTWCLREPTRIATISAGYADGLPLALTNRGHVLINGAVCPVVGRISMDYATVDATGATGVRTGDEVVCLGRSGRHVVTPDDWARLKGTHAYDIICSLGTRVQRLAK